MNFHSSRVALIKGISPLPLADEDSPSKQLAYGFNPAALRMSKRLTRSGLSSTSDTSSSMDASSLRMKRVRRAVVEGRPLLYFELVSQQAAGSEEI
ncbi:MAG TPA: hypothetical protein VGB76_19655 [Pyrinomonadaceae bacterium]